MYSAGSSVSYLNREYGVANVTIYKWIKELSPVQISEKEQITAKEYEKMKKRIAELEMENEILKKATAIRSKTIDAIVTFIEKYKSKYTVKLICKALKFPRSTYYKALVHVPSSRQIQAKQIKITIMKIWKDSKCRYGAPKITKILQCQGKLVSVKRVQRYMKELHICSIVVKKYRYYTEKTSVENKKNLLNRDFSTTKIHQKWCTDITYIHTSKDGWTYLASVMDFHSKKIIGYAYDTSITAELAVKQ